MHLNIIYSIKQIQYNLITLPFQYPQKPYACQVTGCTKRYTDPSSLRKHVKNHNFRDQHQSRRKSHKDTSSHSLTLANLAKLAKTTQPDLIPSLSKPRRFSESSAYTYASYASAATTPCDPTTPATAGPHSTMHFTFDEVFNEMAEHPDHDVSDDDNNGPSLTFQPSPSSDGLLNTMNFHAMSDCIVTIQNHGNPTQTAVSINSATHENQQTLQNCMTNSQHHSGHDDVDQFQFNNSLIAISPSSLPLHQTTSSIPLNQQQCVQPVGVDEYVSFDCVKKLLDDQDMDYMDSTMHAQHIELEYFNEII